MNFLEKIDYSSRESVAEIIKNIAETLRENNNKIHEIINNLESDEAFKTQMASKEMQNNVTAIKNNVEAYVNALNEYSNSLNQFNAADKQTDQTMNSLWAEAK